MIFSAFGLGFCEVKFVSTASFHKGTWLGMRNGLLDSFLWYVPVS